MLSLSHSSDEKLAKLLLDWSTETKQAASTEIRVRLKLTHEEIGQMIGTSRETVTRHLAEWKKQNIVRKRGPILLIRNIAALKAMVSS